MDPELDFILSDDRARIAVRVDGPVDAPAVMLSHPLGADHTVWDAIVPGLASRFRLIRFDTRGHGGSDVTPGDYTLERLGRDALAVLDVLHVERTAFVGLSLGGMIGQWLGLYAPDRVSRLVLADTAPYIGPPESWSDRIAKVRAEGMAGLVEPTIERWLTAGFRQARPDAVERVRAMLSATSPEGYAGGCAAIRDLDLRAEVGRIVAPTLVIGGDQDPTTTPEMVQALADAIPGAELRMLEAGHCAPVEQAEAFGAAVQAFLTA